MRKTETHTYTHTHTDAENIFHFDHPSLKYRKMHVARKWESLDQQSSVWTINYGEQTLIINMWTKKVRIGTVTKVFS